MTAEVSYGQFMDVLEEFAFPEADEGSVKEHVSPRRSEMKKADSSLLAQLFNALERVNLSQLESSGSLASMSSRNSLGSISQANSEANFSEATQFYQAMQQVLIPMQESSSSLNSMENLRQNVNAISGYLPSPLLYFVRFYDEFMHNPAFEDSSNTN